jgi:hypothetical protein
VGKASRLKSQRRRGIGPSRADFEERRAYQTVLAGMQVMVDSIKAERDREQQARWAWAGGAEPPRATLARWRENSVGDRFFSGKEIADAAGAPRLADATLPTPQQMAQDSGHWATAASALVRAVVLDAIPVDDPAVARVLDLLAPVVHAELAVEAEEAEEDVDFPDTHGPLFLLGSSALTDATWAIVGLDPLDQALALMEHRIDEALAGTAGTESRALPGGKVIAEELIRAFAGEYECTEPRDIQTLERLGPANSGNPLVDLVQAEEATPEDALRLALLVLAALADLARTDADSLAGQ